ncbi:MAG: phosphatidylglycerophosphatase A [Phycisphaerae bacterium]|nr:phosphatidylglycerophosphatase A [Phycisphaerae bacterium]
MNSIRKFFITGFGTGYLQPAPGTWGSSVVCVIFLALLFLLNGSGGGAGWELNAAMGVIAILSTIGCIIWGDFTIEAFGKKDPGQCTLDEFAGQAVTLLFLPIGEPGNWQQHLMAVAVAFIAFRLFDIIKPPPAKQAEKLSKGVGVVSDDIIAGVYASIATQIILRVLVGL